MAKKTEEKIEIKKLPKISLSATSNFSLFKSATASCGVSNPDLKMKNTAGAVCDDKQCPEHGILSARGRSFEGTVVKKLVRRIAIEFERTVYIKKYERYMKKKTRLHARLPKCKEASVSVGDYVQIRECRPLSKIIHFVYIKKIRSGENFQDAQKSESKKISDIMTIRKSGEEKGK